jgi:hypothetical protein
VVVLLAGLLALSACATDRGGATPRDEPTGRSAPERDNPGGSTASAPEAKGTGAARIWLRTGAGDVVVELSDTPVTRDVLSMLPLTLPFEDFHATEKISYLPRRLDVDGAATGGAEPGDLIYYVPWGNIAVFYAGGSAPSPDVVPLGTVVEGAQFIRDLDEGAVTVEAASDGE